MDVDFYHTLYLTLTTAIIEIQTVLWSISKNNSECKD